MESERKWLFNNTKYLTAGVNNYVPGEIQLAIWSYIESRRDQKIPLDYLQVFTLKPLQKEGLKFQLIECYQEVPEHKAEILLPCENAISEKLYVIDDVDHVTMLLAKEY